MLAATREAHARLLDAFVRAAIAGDVDAMVSVLASDAVMITDGGEHGTNARGVRNLPEPLHGADRIAAFVVSVTRRNEGAFQPELRELNGQPALVLHVQDGPFAAMLLGVADGKVQRVFFQADPERLKRLKR
jgi:RNA polymerase sigma-70 factor, ECF subfamily